MDHQGSMVVVCGRMQVSENRQLVAVASPEPGPQNSAPTPRPLSCLTSVPGGQFQICTSWSGSATPFIFYLLESVFVAVS